MPPCERLFTERLLLVPITLPLVEAVMRGERELAQEVIGAPLPKAWPGRALIERAFSASLDRIRSDPEVRLWGDRVMITREAARVVGSVVFHGAPDDDGVVEVAYGVDEDSQRQGYATEATAASVEWALAQPAVRRVRAITPTWHFASRRVLEKIGMRLLGSVESDSFGEVLEFERVREPAP